MQVVRIVPNVASEAFVDSRHLYVEMFDLEVSVELDDWYLQLTSADTPQLNIGFLKPGMSYRYGGRWQRMPSPISVLV